MHPGSTLFLDVGSQRDLWEGGAWPLVSAAHAACIAELFVAAAALAIRQGGVLCRHAAGEPGIAPPHCVVGGGGGARAAGCDPRLPVAIEGEGAGVSASLDRRHAYYVTSGCARSPDATPAGRRLFDHLVAGVRDAVVFGAGIEHGVDRTVDALLRRRIRTHVALDACGAADDARAQQVVAAWKRRTVDGATTATVLRLLERATRSQV